LEVTKSYGTTHPTLCAPVSEGGTAQAGRVRAQRVRISLPGRERDIVQGRMKSSRMARFPDLVCRMPATHETQGQPDHHGRPPYRQLDHHGRPPHRQPDHHPVCHTFAAPQPAPRQDARQHPRPTSSTSCTNLVGSTCPSRVLPA
ncbi:hypothetical protein PIB30_056606, partial [Stylosanthes scabra]|nr:hypothetical protein [Stylosanthes scabra]